MLLKELKYVLAIHEFGSMAKAAQQLYITQPALSKYIQNLEESLNVKLFNRDNGRLYLTYSGEKYIAAATRILDTFEGLESELQDVQNTKIGRIHLGVSTFRGTYILPKLMSEFHKLHPGIEFILYEDSSAEIEKLLVRGSIDIAIVNVPLSTPNLDYIPIMTEEILLAIPPDHPKSSYGMHVDERKYPWIDIKHFENDTLILLKETFKTRVIVDSVLRTMSFSPKSVLETANINTAYRLAANGFGVTFVPETFVTNSSSEIKANVFSFGRSDTTITLAVAHRKDTYIPKACQALIDMIKQFYSSDK